MFHGHGSWKKEWFFQFNKLAVSAWANIRTLTGPQEKREQRLWELISYQCQCANFDMAQFFLILSSITWLCGCFDFQNHWSIHYTPHLQVLPYPWMSTQCQHLLYSAMSITISLSSCIQTFKSLKNSNKTLWRQRQKLTWDIQKAFPISLNKI